MLLCRSRRRESKIKPPHASSMVRQEHSSPKYMKYCYLQEPLDCPYLQITGCWAAGGNAPRQGPPGPSWGGCPPAERFAWGSSLPARSATGCHSGLWGTAPWLRWGRSQHLWRRWFPWGLEEINRCEEEVKVWIKSWFWHQEILHKCRDH